MTARDKAIARYARVMLKLTERGCCEWQGGRNPNGYGHFGNVLDKAGLAHRFAWMIQHNRTIPRGHVIMHTCDNPPCVNPDHLLLGTYQDNTNDMWAKGRAAYQNR